MPARQPFTVLCQLAATLPRTGVRPARGCPSRLGAGRADLHVHTTCSDGEYTPQQVVEVARLSGLLAVAVTDHDTLDGIGPARAAADGSVEVIPAVEISAEHAGREVHILGYFVRPDDDPLRQALDRLRQHRQQRFWDMVERLRSFGVEVDAGERQRLLAGAGVLGRRNLAEALVRSGRASTVREAFRRYLGDGGRVALPKVLLNAAEAICLVRGAGGVASWAHPPFDGAQETLRGLAGLGLGAVEVEFPGVKSSRNRHLRQWAGELGLAVTGGSDCHGPGDWKRAVGACGVTAEELAALRPSAEER
jgi:predicted metal-dependent phosphoesterase TrpH